MTAAVLCAPHLANSETTSEPPGASRDPRVLARFEAGIEVSEGNEIRRQKVGTVVRPAACVEGSGMVELEHQQPGAERLVFAAGLVGAADSDRVKVRLQTRSVDAWADGVTLTLAGTDANTWTHHDLPLPAGWRNDSRLRMKVETESGTHGIKTCLGSPLLLGSRDVEAAAQAPNVILISLDTLGARYLGSAEGPPDLSPHLDAFRAGAFDFPRAFVPFGNTLTSHSSLFAALHPIRHGRYALTLRKKKSLPALNSLVEDVAQQGYRTVAITENAFVGSTLGFAVGFDSFDDGQPEIPLAKGNAPGTFDEAISWLGEHAKDSRFFLFVHTYEVHGPYIPRDDESRRIADGLTPDDKRVFDFDKLSRLYLQQDRGNAVMPPKLQQRLRALYMSEINFLDREFQRFLDALGSMGLEDETLVILMSDHGEEFGESGFVGHGFGIHNRLLQIPLAFRWPGGIKQGSVDSVVELIDVMPTVLELIGAPVPDGLDGKSLLPLIEGRKPRGRKAHAYAQIDWRYVGCSGSDFECGIFAHSVQGPRFKLIRSSSDRSVKLYDLQLDPAESRDVSGANPGVVHRLSRLLDFHLSRGPEPAVSNSKQRNAPDRETEERLRALGYIQ